MSENERQEFEEMRKKVQVLTQLIESRFGDRPESIGQLIIQASSVGAVSVGGTVRVVTNQGVFNLLTA